MTGHDREASQEEYCLFSLSAQPVPPDGAVDGSDLAAFAGSFALGDYGEKELADFAMEFGTNACF